MQAATSLFDVTLGVVSAHVGFVRLCASKRLSRIADVCVLRLPDQLLRLQVRVTDSCLGHRALAELVHHLSLGLQVIVAEGRFVVGSVYLVVHLANRRRKIARKLWLCISLVVVVLRSPAITHLRDVTSKWSVVRWLLEAAVVMDAVIVEVALELRLVTWHLAIDYTLGHASKSRPKARRRLSADAVIPRVSSGVEVAARMSR